MKLDYGPLTSLLSDSTISEIMVNSPEQIFVEHKGVLVETGVRFIDERALWDFVFAVLHVDGKDKSQASSFDGTLPDGSRYNIVVPPMTPKFPCITIRKFQSKRFTLQDLVQNKSLNDKAAHFLSQAVKAKMNILVSGGTGSGKTSFLQALTFEIPSEERIVTIEDVAELKIQQKNWVQLLSVQQGTHPVSTRECVVSSLRMRPDRILVGECRQQETFDMLQAMNTGHEGSMTTLHANSPQECLTRLENLLYMSKFELPLKALRAQIANSVNFIVQVKRLTSGQRVVTEIMEISGMEGDVITRAPVFSLDNKGELVPVGYVPRSIKTFQARGFTFPESFFDPTKAFRRAS
ncbi:CpaF family protein [Bdellovibrio svalbardensis]|uniref:CpaF family protein n=1 Tax=Bdellovibrio svalbardensis TaxID=2972972 RepID=A0ABT6DN00_9BACT|nr:CpaF family protein [Bdellovibrio svalbardensis]MDG0817989.1 CpaF family protein [Bdellovibrio svalbardensis]